MAAPMAPASIRHRGTTVDALDLFCGYGGSSQGIIAAGADLKVAANHSKKAIECHAANYPDVDHRRADLANVDHADYVDPADLPSARFIWASPSCKFHSPANARKLYELGPQGVLPGFGDEEEFDHERYANSERSRVTMCCVLRYAAKHLPELVVVENVVECAKWGPDRNGATFRWWLAEWDKIGYEAECLFLNSMFFPPCPQSRDRMYVVLWRKGNHKPDLDYRPVAFCTSDRCGGRHVESVQTWKRRTAAWPLERWGKYRQQYDYRCPECRGVVDPVAWPAYTAIDWSNLGPTIGDRMGLGMNELAATTMERIRRGLGKFRGGPAVIIPVKAQRGSERPVVWPFATQTTQQEHAMVTDGMVIPLRANGVARLPLDQLPTATAGTMAQAVAGRAFMVKNNGNASEAGYRSKPILDPLGAMTQHPTQALAVDGITVVTSGNTFERPGSTCRSRSLADQLWTQHTSDFIGFASAPWLTEMRGGGSVKSGQHSVVDPAHTVTAGGNHHGLTSAAGMFQKINGGAGDTAWHTLDDPFLTHTSRDTTGLVVLPWIEQWRSDPAAVTEQLATVMTHLRHSLACAPPSDLLEPITDDDLMQVRFRMLSPDPELRRSMAFADSYILLGSKEDKTAGLGNAVTPPVAQWVTEQCLATLR